MSSPALDAREAALNTKDVWGQPTSSRLAPDLPLHQGNQASTRTGFGPVRLLDKGRGALLNTWEKKAGTDASGAGREPGASD